jgi:hypothetical protein
VTTEQPRQNPAFEAFRARMYEKYESSLRASMELVRLSNGLFNCPLCVPLHKVIRFIARIVVNSNGAVMALAVNGYGNDAMKVARSMFEGSVEVAYLRLHPELVDDYIDFPSIPRWQLYEYFVSTNPECVKHIPAGRVDAMRHEFELTASRFRNKKGALLGSWCRKSLRKMAEDVGLGGWYPVFYTRASGMEHLDMSGIEAQKSRDMFEVEVAPSECCVKEALTVGFNFTFRVLCDFDDAANLGFKGSLGTVKDSYLASHSQR